MVNSRMDRTQSDVREMEEIDLLELFRAILKHIKLIIGTMSRKRTHKIDKF